MIKKKLQLMIGYGADAIRSRASPIASYTDFIGNGANPIDAMNNQMSPNISKKKSDTNKKRLSAHKVSLFQYSSVKAVSCTGGNKNKSPLLSNGPLELYQIVTPATNNNDKSQEMNYLALGRSGNIVHPILPRLQVNKLKGKKNAIRFLITFYNPERYWELEFLPNNNDRNLLAIIDDFEKIISKICVYKGFEYWYDDGCDDELDYLLIESDKVPSSDIEARSQENMTDEFINQAFKRAIRTFTFPRDTASSRRHSTFIPSRPHRQRQDDNQSKRFSYQGLPLRIASDPTL